MLILHSLRLFILLIEFFLKAVLLFDIYNCYLIMCEKFYIFNYYLFHTYICVVHLFNNYETAVTLKRNEYPAQIRKVALHIYDK